MKRLSSAMEKLSTSSSSSVALAVSLPSIQAGVTGLVPLDGDSVGASQGSQGEPVNKALPSLGHVVPEPESQLPHDYFGHHPDADPTDLIEDDVPQQAW